MTLTTHDIVMIVAGALFLFSFWVIRSWKDRIEDTIKEMDKNQKRQMEEVIYIRAFLNGEYNNFKKINKKSKK